MEKKTNNEVLSGDEIDELVRAINEGESNLDDYKKNNRKIKIYDFCRPDRFSGYTHVLSCIHEKLARSWAHMLYRYFHKDTDFLYLEDFVTVTHEEFLRSFNPTTFLITEGTLDSVLLPLSFVIAVDSCFSIEQSMLNVICKTLLDEYSLIWRQYDINLEFSLKSIENNPMYSIVDEPEEMGALITMKAKIDDKEGLINIFLPYLFLKPLLRYLPKIYTKKPQNEEDTMNNRYKPTAETGLDNVRVQVVVELGRTIKTLKEIKTVGEGTIMQLDVFAGESVDIFVNNVLFGKGEVVVIDDNFGVRFIEMIGQEKEG